MLDFETSVGVVLEQVRHELLREVCSPGPVHVIAVIEVDQVKKDTVGIRYYLSAKEFIVARSDEPLKVSNDEDDL